MTIGVIAYHKSAPTIYFRYLGTAANVTLDRDNPWYTKFDNPNLKRHQKSALMSFLYVEDYEVRHEVLIRVRELGNWVDLDLHGDVYIELDELDDLKQRISEFLLTRNPVLIDGTSIKPMFDRKQPRQGRYQRHATTRTTRAPGNIYGYCWCHHHLLYPVDMLLEPEAIYLFLNIR